MKNCKICNKEFEPTIQKQIYCCGKCSRKNYYLTHKEIINSKAREWDKKNPEKKKECTKRAFAKFLEFKRKRFNELCLAGYYRRKKAKEDARVI